MCALSQVGQQIRKLCVWTSECTSAERAVKRVEHVGCAPGKTAGSGAMPLNTWYWSVGASNNMAAMAGSSKYSTPAATMPTPTAPTQSVTSGKAAIT